MQAKIEKAQLFRAPAAFTRSKTTPADLERSTVVAIANEAQALYISLSSFMKVIL